MTILKFLAPAALPAALVITLSSASYAALPPAAYQAWQKEAPEYVAIKVRSVKTSETDERDSVKVAVTAEVQVKQVRRSRSGLKVGDVIVIRYERQTFKKPMPGPASVPLLVKGQDCPAYLKKLSKGYEPAAGAYSFSEFASATKTMTQAVSSQPLEIQSKSVAPNSQVKYNRSIARQKALIDSMQFSSTTKSIGEVVYPSTDSKKIASSPSQKKLDSALNTLENRTSFLQDRAAALNLEQFSPTTKIQGQTVITIQGGEFR